MKLRWTRRVANDLIAIRAYIAQNNPHNAKDWVDKLRQRANAAAEMPHSGRLVPEINRQDIREALLGN